MIPKPKRALRDTDHTVAFRGNHQTSADTTFAFWPTPPFASIGAK